MDALQTYLREKYPDPLRDDQKALYYMEASELFGQECVELEAENAALSAQVAALDPEPVVCGCREALCPHTPVAKLPRQALVDHFKARIKAIEADRDGLSAQVVELQRQQSSAEPPANVPGQCAQGHSRYWTTLYGTCMACRATDLAIANRNLQTQREAAEAHVEALQRQAGGLKDDAERMRPVFDAAMGWSGAEPSTSVLCRAIDEAKAESAPHDPRGDESLAAEGDEP